MKNFIKSKRLIGLIQMNMMLSMSKRFIYKKNVFLIHDSISYEKSSNYEKYLIQDIFELTFNFYFKGD